MSFRRKSLLRGLLLLFLALVVAAMLIPYSMVELLLRKFAWIGSAVDFLDTLAPGLEMSHLLAFAALGFLARFGWNNGRPLHVVSGVVLVAALVEVVQLWVPGREAALSHALLEALGGAAGFGTAWLLTYAWGAEGLPAEYKPSTQWHGNHSDD